MTQPSLTTTFDTSLIDLAALPGAQRRRHSQQNRHQPTTASSSFNAAVSFSTTEPDTEDDNADDFANDAPSQAVVDLHGFSSSESDDESDESDEENAAPPPRHTTRPSAPPARAPALLPSSSTPLPSQPPPSSSAQTRRTPATTTSAKHSQPSSSPSSSPSTSPSEDHARRPPAKRRKMDPSPSPSPSVPAPSGPDPVERRAGKTSTPVRHMDTTAAYDAWAAVYDEDGNVLQSVDDLELEGLLPAFLGRSAGAVSGKEKVLRVLDLGCGTGRNTEKVVGWAVAREKEGKGKGVKVEVVGVDASKGMLEKAKGKLTPLLEDAEDTSLTLLNHDPFRQEAAATLPPPLKAPFQAVVSTLVLEHLPLRVFFETLASLLVPGGLALITNMHPDMGAISQAGFVSKDEDGRTVKVRGKSWAHGIQETVEAAKVAELEVVDVLDAGAAKGVRERGIDESLIKDGTIGERGWKWVGVKVWFGFVVRKVDGEKEDEGK